MGTLFSLEPPFLSLPRSTYSSFFLCCAAVCDGFGGCPLSPRPPCFICVRTDCVKLQAVLLLYTVLVRTPVYLFYCVCCAACCSCVVAVTIIPRYQSTLLAVVSCSSYCFFLDTGLSPAPARFLSVCLKRLFACSRNWCTGTYAWFHSETSAPVAREMSTTHQSLISFPMYILII